jgi:alcohol dehydrogenase (cytochrome c)
VTIDTSRPSPFRAVGWALTASVLAAAAQAQAPTPEGRGKIFFGQSCASCHGGNLDDGEFGPALKGPAFKASWTGQGPEALFTYIQTRMPPAGPGSLTAQTYGDITAYIRQVNGMAAAPALAAAAPARPAATVAVTPQHAPTLRERDTVYKAAAATRSAKLAALTPVTDAMLRHPADADWLVWRRTWRNDAYSPLKQIGKANVRTLHTAWSWSLPVSENEITPLVHEGVMFLESGNTVQALDAVTGDLLWQYIRALPAELDNGRSTRMKSIALYQDRVIAGTPDGHVVALDAKTGKLVWDQEVFTAAQGARNGQAEGVALHLDGGPIVAKGKVIIGVSLGITNSKGGCFIVALDAATGKEAWRFNTVAQPGQLGGDSWNGAPGAERFGGGVWTAGSYDPDLNLVYFGTGNTYDSATLIEPQPQKGGSNDALFTDSTLALDPDTGKLAWHFQHQNRDVWDLDWVFERTLISLPVSGKPQELVLTGGKTAMFDAVDRATGKYVFSKDLGLQNLVMSVDPKTGHKTTNPALEPEAGKAKLLCPGSSGARNWPTTAFNPTTKILYVPLIEDCADWTYAPRSKAETAAGGIDMRFTPHNMPGADGKFGRVEAINLVTKKVLWTRRQRAPVASSMLATAGGIVFNGSVDRRFSAYDEMTGKILWQTRLNASPSSSPVTYSVRGQQYVAVVTGGGGAFDAQGRGLNPEVDNPAGGTTVVVFKLPGPGDILAP